MGARYQRSALLRARPPPVALPNALVELSPQGGVESSDAHPHRRKLCLFDLLCTPIDDSTAQQKPWQPEPWQQAGGSSRAAKAEPVTSETPDVHQARPSQSEMDTVVASHEGIMESIEWLVTTPCVHLRVYDFRRRQPLLVANDGDISSIVALIGCSREAAARALQQHNDDLICAAASFDLPQPPESGFFA